VRRIPEILIVSLVLGVTLLSAGCSDGGSAQQPLRIATTTSTANSGLLEYLMPEFEKDTGIRVEYIAVGTGKAIWHARNGEVAAILVHAPAAEEAFIDAGFGLARIPVMWNDFVILGPAADPAGISAVTGGAEALRCIHAAQAPFISRGDDSGTHKKEQQLWRASGVAPEGKWYIEAGQGMGASLIMANDKLAYVLCDRGTYLAMREKIELEVTFEGDAALLNPYSIIAVNPAKYPDINAAGAQKLIDWITSPRARTLIAAFRVGGKQLFHLFAE
jgi:tungstate transport system substrate-binding protein